jgi:beta-mannanase
MSKFKIGLLSLSAILLFTGCGKGPTSVATTTTTSTTTTSTTTTTTTTSTTSTTIVGCYIGAFVNGLANTPGVETMIGKNLAVNMWYIDWNTSFPSSDCTTVNNYGGVPMITWEPRLNTSNTLEAISNGNYDTYITNFAQAAKSWGKLVYLRFGHEMNGNWYPWDGYHNGQSLGPAKYISAWKHIHNIFTNVGAANVVFVWSPTNKSTPDESWNETVDYYPGDIYVDWIAINGYNWGNGNWESFDQVFSTIYSTLESYGKPMMIGEFASAENGGDKAAWIIDAFSKIKNNYPKFRIFVWFNINKERDWRINSSTNSLSAFKTAVGDNYFIETAPSN